MICCSIIARTVELLSPSTSAAAGMVSSLVTLLRPCYAWRRWGRASRHLNHRAIIRCEIPGFVEEIRVGDQFFHGGDRIVRRKQDVRLIVRDAKRLLSFC